MQKPIVYLVFFTMILCGCQQNPQGTADANAQQPYDNFARYWSGGSTEIDTYRVVKQQGKVIDSSNVIITFRQEYFSRRKLVQLADPQNAGDDLVKVLAMNLIQRDDNKDMTASNMLSVFTPLDRNKFRTSFKLSFSSQSLEGNSFIQLKLFNENFRVSAHSYRGLEDVEDYNLKQVLLEDGLLNLIRVNHNTLPKGKFEMLPSLLFSNGRSEEVKPHVATSDFREETEHYIYTLQYTQPKRKLTFTFDKQFPFMINEITDELEEDGTSHLVTWTLIASQQVNDISEFRTVSSSDSLALDSIQ